jgi:outer membrane autotransporter protein
VENDAFDESEPINGLGLRVDQRSFESLQTLIGARLSGVANTSYGVLGPYVSAYWVHEFENDSTSIFARYVNDPTNQQFFIPTADPTRDYAVVTVGSTGTFANNLSGFVQFQAALGLKDQTNYGVVLGLRKQF